MNSQMSIESLAFCIAVKYYNEKNYHYDYSSDPRPCHNFVFILNGMGRITAQNEIINVKKGDILFIPQNSTYAAEWEATPNVSLHSVHFKFSLNNDPFIDKNVPVQLLPNEDFENLYNKVKTISQHQNAEDTDKFLYLSAFYCLCATLLPSAKLKNHELKNGNITPAVIYLENNHTKPLKIKDLAALCFLSPSRFYFVFKKQMGTSPIAYKNRLSIMKAAQRLILYKDESIEAIAFNHGFDSPIYFRRLFKKITGKTPSLYRKEQNLI